MQQWTLNVHVSSLPFVAFTCFSSLVKLCGQVEATAVFVQANAAIKLRQNDDSYAFAQESYKLYEAGAQTQKRPQDISQESTSEICIVLHTSYPLRFAAPAFLKFPQEAADKKGQGKALHIMALAQDIFRQVDERAREAGSVILIAEIYHSKNEDEKVPSAKTAARDAKGPAKESTPTASPEARLGIELRGSLQFEFSTLLLLADGCYVQRCPSSLVIWSFADCNVQQIGTAVLAEDPSTKTFDPAGHKRLSTGADGMKKCKVRICELMTAGVVLSRLIATRQKLKFVLGGDASACCFIIAVKSLCKGLAFGMFAWSLSSNMASHGKPRSGLFDVDDNRTLDETEFAAFVTAFIYGLGAAFGLRHKDDIMPSMRSIRPLGSIDVRTSDAAL
eukprot:Skav206486  [mRNA]  locus=scaffold1128:64016:77435:+ [translate_table: standard]